MASSAGRAWLRRSPAIAVETSPLLTTPGKWILFQGHFPLLLWLTFVTEQGNGKNFCELEDNLSVRLEMHF